ncbi:MAG: hypothetical protein AB1500_12835 [Bacillota bacterium]
MDIILRAFIAGATAALVYLTINWAFFLAGVLPFTLTHYTARLVMPPGTPLTVLPLVMGTMADIAASLSAVVAIDLIIRWSGRGYAWLKGLSAGGVLWVIHVAFIPAMAPRVYSTIPPVMVLASFILSILWGLIAALVLRHLPEPQSQQG